MADNGHTFPTWKCITDVSFGCNVPKQAVNRSSHVVFKNYAGSKQRSQKFVQMIMLAAQVKVKCTG
jgi:hypothetical protein